MEQSAWLFASSWGSQETNGKYEYRSKQIVSVSGVLEEVPLRPAGYHDIIILPIKENMNRGKTFAFFDWAHQHAWVPPPRDTGLNSQRNQTTINLAPHDPVASRGEGWTRPDYVLKADDDSLVMLAELEARMRVMPRKLAYWGCE
jgi:hypothetical protein